MEAVGTCPAERAAGDSGPNRAYLGLESVMLGEYSLGPHHQTFALGCEPWKRCPRLIRVTSSSRSSLAMAAESAGCENVTLLGRPREVSLLRNRDEVLQLTEKHLHLLAGRARVSSVATPAMGSKHPISSALR